MSDEEFATGSPYSNEPYYFCGRCRAELKFDQVEFMGQVDDAAFSVFHTCACEPRHVFERRFQVNHGAIKRLLAGFRPSIPYRAAPGPFQPLHRDKERLVTIFAWECEQLVNVAEFLLFATRPAL